MVSLTAIEIVLNGRKYKFMFILTKLNKILSRLANMFSLAKAVTVSDVVEVVLVTTTCIVGLIANGLAGSSLTSKATGKPELRKTSRASRPTPKARRALLVNVLVCNCVQLALYSSARVIGRLTTVATMRAAAGSVCVFAACLGSNATAALAVQTAGSVRGAVRQASAQLSITETSPSYATEQPRSILLTVWLSAALMAGTHCLFENENAALVLFVTSACWLPLAVLARSYGSVVVRLLDFSRSPLPSVSAEISSACESPKEAPSLLRSMSVTDRNRPTLLLPPASPYSPARLPAIAGVPVWRTRMRRKMLTKSLLAVVCFLLAWLPANFFILAKLLLPTSAQLYLHNYFSWTVSAFLINSVTNAFVYKYSK